MAQGDIPVTIIGNLTADPELRFTQSGAAVASFTVVSTPRVKRGDKWEDGEPTFLRCNLWRQPAENAAECLAKGQRVMVTGRLKQRSFETREGEKRTVFEVEAEEVGASIKFGTVAYRKAERTGEGGWQGQQQQARSDDPWGDASPPRGGYGSPPPNTQQGQQYGGQQGGSGFGGQQQRYGGFSEEPPF